MRIRTCLRCRLPVDPLDGTEPTVLMNTPTRTPQLAFTRQTICNGVIAPGISLADAFRTLTEPLIAQADQRACALDASADPETLHKLRVALRRLRSLWWAYGPLVDTQETRQHRREFKALADAAGFTRNWDILRTILAEDVATQHALPLLSVAIDRLRHTALVQSRRIILDAGIAAMIEQRRDRVIEQLDSSHHDELLETFAAQRIEAAFNALQKRISRAQSYAMPDCDQLHDVRIAGKRLRYVLEFFAPVSEAARLIGIVELTLLQDELGKLNDVVSSEILMRAHAAQFDQPEAVATVIAALTQSRMQQMAHATGLIRGLGVALADPQLDVEL